MSPRTTDAATARSQRHAITAGIAGNVLEWYDFAVYGYFAPVIARIFFPSEDPLASLVATFGAFAAGFLMRPFGGVVFGYIGDRLGRRRALIISVLLMAVPTCAVGLLPGHAQIGAAAAVLMVLMRMLQGLSVGGEYTGSVVFLVERAPAGRRGFFACWTIFGAVGGILLGSVVGALLSTLLTEDQLYAWGWRLPFIAGLGVGLMGYLIRRHLVEPPAEGARPANPVVEAFRTEWRAVLRVIGFSVVNAVGFYMIFVYVVTFLVDRVKVPASRALDINSISMLVLLATIPAMALVGDRVGRRPLLLGSVAVLAVLAWPLLWLMHHPSVVLILVGQVGFALLIGTYFGAAPAAMAEAFPRRVRCSALSVGYNLCLAVFGGTTPMVASWMILRSHDDLSIAWYLAAAAVVSFVVVLRMPETARAPLR